MKFRLFRFLCQIFLYGTAILTPYWLLNPKLTAEDHYIFFICMGLAATIVAIWLSFEREPR